MTREENIARLYSVVVVDSDGGNLEAFRLRFRDSFNILTAVGPDDCMRALSNAERETAVIVADMRIGDKSGIDLLSKVKAINPDIVTILTASFADPSLLVSAINRGVAGGFILKPWNRDDMSETISDAIAQYHVTAKNKRRTLQIKAVNEYLKEEVGEAHRHDRIVGANGGLREVMEQVRRVSGSTGHVLLEGEPGSGREMIARAMHSMSPRGGRAFIKLNTASFDRGGLEPAIFGFEKISGGEHDVRSGRVELAEGSALFIDDIADLPIETQIKLYRLITERQFERIGGSETIASDVRIISATRKNLAALVSKRQFREDLFNAISVVTIQTPPLRERPEDIPALAQHFAESAAIKIGGGKIEIDPAAIECLENHDWPGNIAELECVVKRAVQTAGGSRVTAEHLGFGSASVTSPGVSEAGAMQSKMPTDGPGCLNEKLSELEREELVEALKKADGHKALAAKILGINRSTMYYRMKKHRIS